MKFLRLALIALPLFIVSVVSVSAYKYATWQSWQTLVYSSTNAGSCGQITTPFGYPYMVPPANVTGSYGMSAYNTGWFSLTCTGPGGSATAWEYLDVSPPPSVNYFGSAGCTIPAGQNNCYTHVWWGIQYAQQPRMYLDGDWYWAWAQASGDFYHDFSAIGPGWHRYTAWDVGGAMDTQWVEKACAPSAPWNGTVCGCPVDTLWNGSYCAASTGTITANPTTCTIAINGEYCSSLISFTTQNTNWATVWTNASPFLGGTSGSGTHSAITYGSRMFYLNNGNQSSGKLLGQVEVTGKCAQGSMWNGTFCAPPTGTISANPQQCTIAQGSNTCSTALTWSTANTDGAKVFTGGSLFASGLSGSNVAYNSVPFGSVNVTLKNAASDGDTQDLASVVVSGTCGGANEFDTTKSFCVPPTPVIDGSVTPGTVPYNGPVSITWSIKYPNNSCKIQAILKKPTTCNATCQADVASEETLLNTNLSSGNTNQNDPNGRRLMSTALSTEISGQYAKGVKTVNLKYQTEFQFTCDTAGQPGVISMPAKAVKKIIYIIDKNEG